MFCSNCFNENDFVIKQEMETIEVRGEDIVIESQVTYCKKCGNKIWNEDLDDKNLIKAYEKYKENHNLLSANEIKDIREKYGLTQQTFARILGVGDKTITRYENGAIQDTAINNLIFLMKNINNFKKLFEERKNILTEIEISKIDLVLKQYEPSIITNSEYKKPVNNDLFFGGFTYEERKLQYNFENAVQGL